MTRWQIRLGALLLAVIGAACGVTGDPPQPAARAATTRPAPTPTTTVATSETIPTTVEVSTTTTTRSPYTRPEWLGTRELPERPDGFGRVQPTPPELQDRRFATPSLLPPPASNGFESTISAIPADVLARSSWHEDCPVGLDDLAYITVSHVGFDGNIHTGEMIVNGRVAADVVGVFAELYAAGFPIEEMRVIRAEEIDAPPTGDGNVTGSFACREAVNSGNWSQHAYGLAIDVNPFHNPYLKGDLVIPELASFYLDRDLRLPGMVETSIVVEAFASIGWRWGGNWNSLKDWMHFSESGT